MIQGIQLLGIFFGLIMIYLTFYNYKRKGLTKQSLCLWIAIWLGIIVVAIFPTTLYGIMEELSVARTVDFITLTGFAFFAVLIFYLHNKINFMQEKMARLVRNMAIEAVETKGRNKEKIVKKKIVKKKVVKKK